MVARPVGEPVRSDFELREAVVPEPGPGQLLVRNTWMSVDPYMRGRMNAGISYIEPFALGEVLDGGAVGEVVRSEAPDVPMGATVLHGSGWREWAMVPAAAVEVIDPAVAPPQAFLGVLGMPGVTAYVGLLDIAQLKAGDVVFVSGAAGAVGSVVGQLAKLRGHRVIGSAGSAAKVRHVVDRLGFDAAFDYREGPVVDQLRLAAPDGIDVFFDNVGGEHLEAGIELLRQDGRAALCGAISSYNSPAPAAGPDNMFRVVGARLTLRGFIVSDHRHRSAAAIAELAPALNDGRLVWQETVVEGIEQAPAAMIDLLRGANTGKMLVRL
ncbi:MAG: NADP-dependent oxidoreductase [Solirubrobacterales bacterium]|nr:NADP-dependent oxidoreductase [Solirubrobacterales bacterium]